MPDEGHGGFEEMLRALAREMSEAAERISEFDPDELARSFGIDPGTVRHWVDEAGRWMRSQSGGEVPWSNAARRGPAPQPERPGSQSPEENAPGAGDPLRSARPHPLDVPTDEQGTALAALDSGRWYIEPGTEALASRGDGPGPNDALGLVRELRARDWISADGEITLTGQRALARWLDAPPRG